MFSAHEARQVFTLLLAIAVFGKLVDAEIGMCSIREANRSRGARDLFHGDDVLQVAELRAAELFVDGDAKEP